MPLSEQEKDYIVNQVVQILGAPDKKARIDALREQVVGESAKPEDYNPLDEAVYSVVQAIEELYG